MANLIAYIPVINRQYLDWVDRYHGCRLYLISQELAETSIPRLARNLIALPTGEVARYFATINKSVSVVSILHGSSLHLLPQAKYLMPDEDLSHAFAERYLQQSQVTFEEVWGRWDMSAVKRQEPVVEGVEISTDPIHWARIQAAIEVSKKSPDWWRQVGLVAHRGDHYLGAYYNGHYPTEYEAAVFGDPRLNLDAGEGRDIYLSLHAERSYITGSAREGASTKGTSVFINVFPCRDCCTWIVAAGVEEVFFFEGYSVLGGLKTLQATGIRVVKVQSPEPA